MYCARREASHLSDPTITTRGMMRDVLLALVPVVAISIWMFHWHAVVQIGLCMLSCAGFEVLFTRARGRAATLGDGSALITGVILGLIHAIVCVTYKADQIVSGLAVIIFAAGITVFLSWLLFDKTQIKVEHSLQVPFLYAIPFFRSLFIQP